MNHERLLLALLTTFLAAAGTAGQEATGIVTAVSGKTVTIRLEAGPAPSLGDKVALSDEVPGVGRLSLRGTWRVTNVEVGSVTAAPEPEGPVAGDPQAGHHATIRVTVPARGEPPGRPKPRPVGGKRNQATMDLALAIFPLRDSDRVRELIKAGADPNDAVEHGYTYLMSAARRSSASVVEALLDGGAAIDAQTDAAKSDEEVGHTALMEAVEVGNRPAAEVLIRRKANLDLVTKTGHTALFLAVERMDVQTVRLLLEAGANASVVNKKGQTALDLARLNRDPSVIALLEAAAKGAPPAAKEKAPAAPNPRKGWVTQRPAVGRFSMELPPEYKPDPNRPASIALQLDTRGLPPPVRVVKVFVHALPEGYTVARLTDFRLQDLANTHKSYQTVGRFADVRIQGEPAEEITYTYDWEGRVVKGVTCLMVRKAHGYEISFLAFAEEFDAVKAEFREILMGFRFE